MIQQGFNRLDDGYETDKEAMKARNAYAKELRAKGYRVKCWTLRNQLKKYWSLGNPCGIIRNVYMVDAYPPPEGLA